LQVKLEAVERENNILWLIVFFAYELKTQWLCVTSMLKPSAKAMQVTKAAETICSVELLSLGLQ